MEMGRQIVETTGNRQMPAPFDHFLSFSNRRVPPLGVYFGTLCGHFILRSLYTIRELDVSPYVTGVLTFTENLTNCAFHNEMRLLNDVEGEMRNSIWS
jgi:hypothetical protein